MPPAHKPPVLSDADITSTTLTLTAAWKADRRLWADNGVLCIIPVEYLNLLPFVVRVMHRMVSRRRFLNISEAVFFWMWAWLLLLWITKAINWFKQAPSLLLCQRTSIVENMGRYISVGTVPFAMSIKTIALWHQRHSSVMVSVVLAISAVQLGLQITGIFREPRTSHVIAESCAIAGTAAHGDGAGKPWPISPPWLGSELIVTDAIITALALYPLLKQRGPAGFMATSRVLWRSAIHYCVLVTALNVLRVATAAAPDDLPDIEEICFVLQTIVALRLLAMEQDCVHGYSPYPRGTPLSHPPSPARATSPRSKPTLARIVTQNLPPSSATASQVPAAPTSAMTASAPFQPFRWPTRHVEEACPAMPTVNGAKVTQRVSFAPASPAQAAAGVGSFGPGSSLSPSYEGSFGSGSTLIRPALEPRFQDDALVALSKVKGG